MKYIIKFYPFFIIFTLCLTPIIWFLGRDGMLINGVDTNFPLDPLVWFGRRFFVWNAVANGGTDFSSSTAGIFFHLIQTIPYQLGFNLQLVQILSFIFWFSLTVVSSYILARILLPNKLLIQLLFVVFYSFNIYLFNTWENVKVANLALVSAIPLSVALLILLWENKINYGKASLYSILIGIIISGGGINPAYFFSFFLILFIFLIANLFLSYGTKPFVNKLCDFLLIIIIVSLVNAFWILPTTFFVAKSIPTSESIDKIGFANWLDSLSEHTSLLNILRLQGAWDWYAFDSLTGLPLYIPYALNYLYSLPFLGFSFLIPSLVLFSFILPVKDKKYFYWVSGLLILTGVFLVVGTHPPTGSLFRWLTQHVPFFSLFRSPWYVFTPLIILAYAILICLFFSTLQERIKAFRFGRILVLTVILILIVGNLFYSYPLISGKIFRPTQTDSFYVKFPDYIFSAKDWLNKNNQGRIIGYPDDEIEQFEWGYRGVDSILNLLVNNETIYAALNVTDSEIAGLTREFYKNIKKNQIDAASKIAAKLNIALLFNKGDQTSLAPQLPDIVKQSEAHQFGSWFFYKFPNNNFIPKIYTATNLIGYDVLYQKEQIIGTLENNEILVNQNDHIVDLIPNIDKLLGQASIGKNSQNEDFFNLVYKPSKLSNRLLSRDPNRVEYIFYLSKESSYQPILEKYHLQDFGLDPTKKIEVEVDGKKTFWEPQYLTDSYLYFYPITLKEGKHKISFILNNNNLIGGGGLTNKSGFWEEGEGVFNLESDNNGSYLTIMNRSNQDISANFPASSFDPMAQYLIKLRYKQIYGNNGSIVVKQFNDKTPFKTQAERLPNYPEWNTFSFYYEPVKTPSQMTVNLSSPSTEDPLGTKILYADLSMYKVFSNALLLKAGSKQASLAQPKITFQKESPVLYEGMVENGNTPYVLIFSENYSPNWELSILDINDSKIITDSLHFSANLYANAWYIKGIPGNYKFRIYYKPQNLFLIGSVLSGATVILTLIIVSSWLFKYNLRRKDGKINS